MLAFAFAVLASLLPPVDGPVVRPFEPPASTWAPGHRGVDYAVPPGTPVRAAAAGRVTFAGEIAGGRHVVVLHSDGRWPDGLRSSYAYLAEITVTTGDEVDQRQVIGRSGGRGEGHDGTVVHFGLRRGERYIDPACPARSTNGPATLTATQSPGLGIRTPATHR